MDRCSEMQEIMHDLLDEDISISNEEKLNEHLKACITCQDFLTKMQRIESLLEKTPMIKAPENFTENVMVLLPEQQPKQSKIMRWARRNPFLLAASLFIFLMGSVYISYLNEANEFTYSNQSAVQVEGTTVIVPAGETIKGDLVVENGDVRIEGKVEGDVTVIHGKPYLASAGEVTGEIDEVDEVFSWTWYKIKSVFN